MKSELKRKAVYNAVKLTTGLVAGFGAKKIIRYAIEKVIPETLGKSENALVVIGSYAIAVAVGNVVGDQVELVVESFVESVVITKELFKEMQNNQNDVIDGEFVEVT